MMTIVLEMKNVAQLLAVVKCAPVRANQRATWDASVVISVKSLMAVRNVFHASKFALYFVWKVEPAELSTAVLSVFFYIQCNQKKIMVSFPSGRNEFIRIPDIKIFFFQISYFIIIIFGAVNKYL